MAKAIKINPNDFRTIVHGLYNSPLALEALKLANPEREAEIDSIVANVWQSVRYTEAELKLTEYCEQSREHWTYDGLWNIVNIGVNPSERHDIADEVFDKIFRLTLQANLDEWNAKYKQWLKAEQYSLGLRIYDNAGDLMAEILNSHKNDYKVALELHHGKYEANEISAHINFIAFVADLCEEVDAALHDVGIVATLARIEKEESPK